MIDLDDLMRLREAATPGPWKVATWYGGYHTIRPKKEPEKSLGQIERKADATYIVAACNDTPEMVQKIRVLLKEHRETLEEYNQFLRKHIKLLKRFNKVKKIAIIEGQIIQELLAKGEEQGRQEEDDA